MIAKGQDADNIELGDTLADDQFAGRTFDFCMSNPPYGVDWKASQKAVKDGAHAAGPARPVRARSSASRRDGQMLFLLAPRPQDAPSP